jgi:hypothetical protein
MFYFQVRYNLNPEFLRPEVNLNSVFYLNLEFLEFLEFLSLQELASNKQETLQVLQLFLK